MVYFAQILVVDEEYGNLMTSIYVTTCHEEHKCIRLNERMCFSANSAIVSVCHVPHTEKG